MQPGHNTTETSSALWNAALNANKTPAKNRGRTKKSDIIHFPEFEEASQLVDDEYWRIILRNCARKKLPRGFSYSDRLLRHRGNDIAITLPNDAVAFGQTAIYFFQENGRLYSKRDQELRKKRDEEVIISQLTSASSNWTCVARSKNRRATHIRDYVERKYAHLNQAIRDELYTQINVGFEKKFITKEHVTFENSQIVDIDGLDANESGIFYTRQPPATRLTQIVREQQPKDKNYRHYENWCKYMDEYRKYIITSAKSSHTIQTSSYLSGQMASSSQNSPVPFSSGILE